MTTRLFQGTGKSDRAFAIALFLLLGALMASLAGISLAGRGTALDRMWVLNPRAYGEPAPFGKTTAILFLLPALALVLAGWAGSGGLGLRDSRFPAKLKGEGTEDGLDFAFSAGMSLLRHQNTFLERGESESGIADRRLQTWQK
jgi:hypothetical protein